MIRSTHSVTADFDGTLFDPNLRAFIAWIYNRKTSKLLTDHNIPYILNTGRPIWDTLSEVNLGMVGMKKPDVVIYGAGTKIEWRRNNIYELDQDWEKVMQKARWDKQKTIESIAPIIKEYDAKFYDTKNEYMTRVWVHKMPVSTLSEFILSLQKVVENTKILRTEQILLPNTETFFSGYLLLIPSKAGKEEGMKHVLKKLSPKISLAFGDALVDIPMLVDKSSVGYVLNPTALARKELKNTKVTILEGSPPENLLKIVTEALSKKNSVRNSPYRSISNSIFALIEPLVYPKLTPNQLSVKGLDLVHRSLSQTNRHGIIFLVQGFLMDVFDGIRARRQPELIAEDGQLVDVRTDRMKEFLLLSSRGNFDAAISCFLPSIARAQAEAVGVIVNEFDSAGGSALSRSIKLIKSYLLHSFGNVDGSNRVDNSIYLSNLQTFQNRKSQAKSFSWNKLKDYDQESVKRLLFLVDLLKEQLSRGKIQDQNLKEALKEYVSM